MRHGLRWSRIYRGLLGLGAIGPLLISACAPTGGGSAFRNDPLPVGTLVTQKEFTLLFGESVQGIAKIYVSEAGTYTIRLEAFSVPSSTGLRVRGMIDGSTQAFLSNLPAANGNMNFTTSRTSSMGGAWTSVDIVIAGVPTGQQLYAQAAFEGEL